MVGIFMESEVKSLGVFSTDWSQDEIKNEPMLFNCDRVSAYNLGGDITKHYIDNLPKEWTECDIVVDSRVHMLMPNWYPAIPGFHHDDVPRSGNQGQPNYINPEYCSEHLMGLVNGDICPTEFCIGSMTLEIPTEGVIYKTWHPIIHKRIQDGLADSYLAPSGQYLGFNHLSFHQATPAIASGWRWFIRLSKNTDRTSSCTNEVRKQVQVYLEHPMEGW